MRFSFLLGTRKLDVNQKKLTFVAEFFTFFSLQNEKTETENDSEDKKLFLYLSTLSTFRQLSHS